MSYPQIKTLLVLIGMAVSFGYFAWKLYQMIWLRLRQGRAGGPVDQWTRRLQGLVEYVAAQKRLFRFLLPGTAHFFIFWGFIILSLTIIQAIIEGVTAAFAPEMVIPFLGTFGPLALLQDILAVCVTIAVVYDLYVRIALDPERYKGSHRSEGIRVLLYIFTIMFSLIIMNASRIQQGEDLLSAWRPISNLAAGLMANLSEPALVVVEEAAYWIHLVIVFIFLTELPGGKHFHVVTSIPGIFLRNLDPPGRLPPAPEFDRDVGVRTINQFTRRQLLDLYNCTECGRCQEYCPAYTAGMELSPKLLIMGLRDELLGMEVVPVSNPGRAVVPRGDIVGSAISEAAVWACTTCYACDQECPLLVEHVAPIVDLRRHLVMDGRMDDQLQDALGNLGRYGNSFGQSERARAKWTRGLDFKIKDARREPVQVLWFLGDYASYSPALSEITIKTAEIMQAAGLDFGILYDGERNSGNDVRRVGEEGLFEMLVEENQRAIDRSGCTTIVTTDPHSYNALKHEYPLSENGHRVIHFAELIDELILRGALRPNVKLNCRVTYHDPCYLGRYNDVYDAPRRVLATLGCELVEMKHHHDRAICCGAGGGRIWMDEGEVSERPSERRIREALDLPGIDTFVVTCPKDVTMFRDAVKTTGSEDRIIVRDLAELVYEALDLSGADV
ncbi:MAG: heterodisulfide reductase-related iron-sulfur binding cluster [Anaerolineales bacterium]